MNSNQKTRKAKAGLLLIASPRFKTLGEGLRRDTLDEDDFIDYLCAGTLVGSLEASGSVPRTGRRHVKVVMGSREEVTGQIRLFASAARARAILRQSNLGLLANYNEAMWSTYIDPP